MAADVTVKDSSPLNSCCKVWKEKFLKSEGGRKCLREAVKLYKEQTDKIQAENMSLKKAHGEEQARADAEREGKEKELAVRVSLENDISSLTSEICSLKKKGSEDAESKIKEVKLLQDRVSKGEKEIKQLKELIEKEKRKADSEKKNAEAQKKSSAEAWKLLKAEKAKADEERNHAYNEGRKAEEYRLQLEELKKEADESKAKLASEALKFEEASRKLEAEKHRLTKERKHADSQMARAEEPMKLAESHEKKVLEEQSDAENLHQQLEDARKRIKELQKADDKKSQMASDTLEFEQIKRMLQAEKHKVAEERKHADSKMDKAEELRKLAEANEKKFTEERSRAENLSQQLEDARRRIEELHKADEYRLQLQALRKEADKTKSKLVSQTLKLEEANRKLEGEKHKVTEERNRADSEMAKAEEQRKLTEASVEKVMEERSHAEQLSQQLEAARQRIDELQNEINGFVFSGNSREVFGGQQANGDAADRYRLGLDNLRNNMDHSKFEVEKEKYAYLEMVKEGEQRNFAEMNKEMLMEEHCLANQLSHQLEEARFKIEELQRQMQELLSSRKLLESSNILPERDKKAERTKVKLLKKHLKLEKMRLKHAKQVAKLEKDRNSVLLQELGCLKLDFSQISRRLDVLGKCFSPGTEGTKDMEKVGKDTNVIRPNLKRKLRELEPFQLYLQNGSELLNPSCMAVADSHSLRQTPHCTSPLLPKSLRNYSESISGIDSKLESLHGGSNRKLLQSSAITSSSESFSDGQLVGSQERDAFLTKSEENFNAEATVPNMFVEVNKMQHNENLALTTENSVGSPHGSGLNRKRRMMFDTIESVEVLYLEGKKLHLRMEEKLSVLHDMLNRQIDKPLEDSKYVDYGGSYAKHKRFHKKRKVSQEEKLIMQHLSDRDELEKMQKIGNEDLNGANACGQASNLANNLMVRTPQACGEGSSNSFPSDIETSANFEGGGNGNYMKLLDLDDTADEECYRRAMETPMSPTLPEILFPSAEIDMDNLEPLIDEKLLRGLPNENEILVSSHSFDVTDMEIGSVNAKYNASGTNCNKLPYRNEGPVDSINILGNINGSGHIIEADKTYVRHNGDSVVEVETSNMPSSGDDGQNFSSEVACQNIPAYCVMYSNVNDNRSISRVFSATRNCMARCFLNTQTESMMQKILQALKMEENILLKEKACVFFTLLLLNFSVYTRGKPQSFLDRDFVPCSESFARHIDAVMYDFGRGSVLAELCCLEELLGLIENFLLDGRVIYADMSSETFSECGSKISILLDGVNINLFSKPASADQLVAGSIILASTCAAADHIGFMCEASYNLLRMHGWDTTVLLSILHVFAYLGGERLFSLKKYHLTMTVVKSIVLFLEGGNSLVASASSLSSMGEVRIKVFPCAKCPFSGNAVSIDMVTSALLEKLQSCVLSETVYQHLLESANLSNSGVLCHKDIAKQGSSCEEVHSVIGMTCDACCSLNKCVMSATKAGTVINKTLCDLSDLLSLLELLACNMSWKWISGNIIPELLEMLAKAKLDNFAAAVVVLLGQLGRLGVMACGYEDEAVENLRCKLSGYLWHESAESTVKTAALPVQIAIVTALLGLLSIDFEKIVQNNLELLPVPSSQSVFTDRIRNWFSLLSKEQQALSFSLLQSAVVELKSEGLHSR